VQQRLHDRLLEHRAYVNVHGTDLPDVAQWRWPARTS